MAHVSIWEKIKKTAHDDEYMKNSTQQAQTQAIGPYSMCHWLIFFKGKVVVPLQVHESLIFEAHDTKIGGLSRVLRTYKRLKQKFYWPSMFQTIHDYMSKCEICQKTKASTLKLAGFLQPLLIPCQVWDDINVSLDSSFISVFSRINRRFKN